MAYIERDTALESLCTGCEYVPIEEKEVCPYRFTGCQEYANIFAIPAADVAPVVRCKDCKHYDDGLCHRVHNPAQYSKIPDDWFCADGERKNGDG